MAAKTLGKAKTLELRAADQLLELALASVSSCVQNTFARLKPRSVDESSDRGYFHAVRSLMPVAELTPEGVIVDANERFLRVFGYTTDELVGMNHKTLCDQNYSSSSAYREFWLSLLSGETHVDELQRVHKSGKPIWIQASYVPIFNANGNVTKIIVFATDLTSERKHLASLHYRMRPISANS